MPTKVLRCIASNDLEMMQAKPPIVAAKFERALPSIVKSVRQRDLLSSWLRLDPGKNTLPRLADYATGPIADDLVDVMTLEVNQGGSEIRFRIIPEKSTISIATDANAQNGIEPLFLDLAMGPERYQIVLPYYQTCLEHRRPIYSFAMVQDDDGKEVSYERLLLPFGESETVTHIVGLFKTMSIDGGFKIKDLMTLKADQSVSITRAIIDGYAASSRADQTHKAPHNAVTT